MSENTKNLGLFKYDPDLDKKSTFNIELGLNNNWDKIDDNIIATKYDIENSYNALDWVFDIIDGKKTIFESLIDNNQGNPLTDDTAWKKVSLGGGSSLTLFDTVLKDHILSFEETQGYALQGTYVYKNGVAGERYGYPDFYNKCVEEKNLGVATQTTLGGSTITTYNHANGHIYYDISDKGVVDNFFNANGVAWFYGVDTANERIFLPRNEWFIQATGDVNKVNKFNDAGLPNITGYFTCRGLENRNIVASGALMSGGASSAGSAGDSQQACSIKLDASISNPIYGNSTTVQPKSSNKLLYIVVGNTSEVTHLTTTIPDVEVLSQINKNKSDITDIKDEKIGRQDCKAYITETYVNDTSGYIVYSNGYCEQWGRSSTLGYGGVELITLLKPYRNANYVITGSGVYEQSAGDKGSSWALQAYSATQIRFRSGFQQTSSWVFWKTSGYL